MRVEGQVLPVRPIEGAPADGGSLDDVPELGLSEDVFAASDEAPPVEASAPAEASEPAGEEPPTSAEEAAAGDTFERADELAQTEGAYLDQPAAEGQAPETAAGESQGEATPPEDSA